MVDDPDARRYEINREAARHHTELLIRFLSGKQLMPAVAATSVLAGITDDAISMADGWTFPWRRIMGQNRPYFRRFELALWEGGTLWGLAVGRSSRGPDNVTIHFLERAPGDNPFTGYFAQIALDAADRYAKLIMRQRVKLKNPALGILPKYEALGFSLAEPIKNNTYYARKV